MKKEKIITPTTSLRDLIDVMKKLKFVANDCVILPNGEYYISREDGVKSIVQIHVPGLDQFYHWAALSPIRFLTDIKDHSIKVNGTSVEDTDRSVNIFKNGNLEFQIEKIYDKDTEIRKRLAARIYGDFYPYVTDIRKNISWIRLASADIQDLLDGNSISIFPNGTDLVAINKAIFPMLKDLDTPIFITDMGEWKGTDFSLFGFREEYPLMTIYSIGAYLKI